MTTKITFLALCLFFSGQLLLAQKYIDLEFEENPDFELTEEKKQKDYATLLRDFSVEYAVEDDGLVQYTMTYAAEWINSDKAIEQNNKIYLSSNENTEYIYQKARVIKPSGETVILKESDIKEGVYGEQQQKYYYFALEGLEKGSIIETMTYKKSNPSYYGNLIYYQGEEKRYKQTFELICPNYLLFAFKSINGAPEAEYDTTVEEVNRWSFSIDTTEAILDQPNVFVDVVKSGILYKLDRNSGKNISDITSYGTASQSIYNNLHPELSKKDEKSLAKIYKSLKISSLKDEQEKVKAIENYIKSTFQVIDASYPNLQQLEFILENKTGNTTGLTILHIALLELAEIEFEVVLTTDRSSMRFDPEFEAYLFLDHYLLYFPKSKSYLAPTEKFLRTPYVPSLWTHNYGLFIKEVTVGSMKTAIGKVKFIEALPYTATADNMMIDVSFEANKKNPEVSIRRENLGYSAEYFQPYYHLLDEEEQEDLEKTLVEMISEELKAEEVKVENVGENDFGSRPFVYEFTTTDHSFIEKAGEDILFKLGELIGPQVEMYQENERQYDVESVNNRYYKRTITFDVPEGYQVKNLEELNFDYKFGEEGNENLWFESSYTKKGDSYVVECVEYYTDIVYPISYFNKYKQVINAAADFNKIVLVFEKIQ